MNIQAADAFMGIFGMKRVDRPGDAYGCWNTERQPGYWAKNGIEVDSQNIGQQRMVWIEDVMSKDCRTVRLVTDDPRCKGCGK